MAAAEAVVSGTAADMELLVAEDGQIAINAVELGVGAVAAARSASASAKRRLGVLGLGTLAYRAGVVAAA